VTSSSLASCARSSSPSSPPGSPCSSSKHLTHGGVVHATYPLFVSPPPMLAHHLAPCWLCTALLVPCSSLLPLVPVFDWHPCFPFF
jgi:hypothetical protein